MNDATVGVPTVFLGADPWKQVVSSIRERTVFVIPARAPGSISFTDELPTLRNLHHPKRKTEGFLSVRYEY
jgi:hypothetical protein